MDLQYSTLSPIKASLGRAAAALVQEGMTVGLGTGTTAAAFIYALAARCRDEGLHIRAVATSVASEQLATSLGIPCVPFEAIDHIDLTVDGADEVDQQRRLIKGHGGALLREKIMAYASRRYAIIVEERKCVVSLGQALLPVEVLPFGHTMTARHLADAGFRATLRTGEGGQPYCTDNGNYIYDLGPALLNPEADDARLHAIPGVLETGLFLRRPDELLVGKNSGVVVSQG